MEGIMATPRKKPNQKTGKASDGSREARRTATAILEVMAGVRTPTDAAKALGVSTPRFYVLEERALQGMVAACEPRPKGPSASPQREAERLKRQVERLEREVMRQQALARTAQRAVGLSAPPKAEAKPAKGKTRKARKPSVRALKLATRLQSDPPADSDPPAVEASTSD
jgi:hypothetical protein